MGDLDDLAAGFPAWNFGRSTRDGAFTAWLPGARVFRDPTVPGLRAQLEAATGERAGPGDLAVLRERFPEWVFDTQWTPANSGPDARQLVARRGDVTVTGWTVAGIAAAIENVPR